MGFKRSRERMERLEVRLRQGMDERGIRGEAQDAIVRGITSFALYGFPESHAASFALIAYASAYLKCHHPAAFLAGLLAAWPMGFYSPASLVKDAQRHGVEVRPIDVARSGWLCTLETSTPATSGAPGNQATSGYEALASARGAGARSEAQPSEVNRCAAAQQAHRAEGPTLAVRLGLRFVRGLGEVSGRRIETARSERPFAHAADLARRAGLSRGELAVLAELGALASVDASAGTRREALWQVAGLEPDPRSLFAGAPPPSAPSPLPDMTPLEETLADYRASGLSTGPHVMAHLRPRLAAQGLLAAAELRALPNGRWVRTAGHVIVRQRPGSAKGMCFLTLEDETGTSNAVLTPPLFRRFRVPLHTTSLVAIAGPLQNVDGVVHVRVERLAPLDLRDAALPDSHDYR